MTGIQQARVFSEHVTIDVQLPYLIYLPAEYGKSDRTWPLMLFLHGAGERGSDLDLVSQHGPPKLAAAGRQFPFILVSPQCQTDEYWSVHILKALLDRILATHRVDRSRIYLTGLSMGGNGTWRLATAHPGLFAALVPICGWGDASRVGILKEVPVWAFHGKKDPVVVFERGERMVRALTAAGGNVKFTVYPNAGHDSWTQAYDDPALYTWMMEQRKK
ncbi:MAG TPA: prolyl oligopeptidase family serine peptidase [Bacteroidota bacterium]|nr:prolyl oligopeptidase family serine peptidase [Bacteroidota bacterium]